MTSDLLHIHAAKLLTKGMCTDFCWVYEAFQNTGVVRILQPSFSCLSCHSGGCVGALAHGVQLVAPHALEKHSSMTWRYLLAV